MVVLAVVTAGAFGGAVAVSEGAVEVLEEVVVLVQVGEDSSVAVYSELVVGFAASTPPTAAASAGFELPSHPPDVSSQLYPHRTCVGGL